MTAKSLILKGITDEASIKAEEILEKAKAESEEIIEKAKAEAKTFAGEVVSTALKKAVAIKANAESAADLVIRDAKLKRKNREISEVITTAAARLSALPDEDYFALLLKMISKIAEDTSGEILLSEGDLKNRKTDILVKGIKQKGFKLELSKTSADIKSGFILKYGDILINSSFEAIIAEKKEKLEDAVKDVLFNQ